MANETIQAIAYSSAIGYWKEAGDAWLLIDDLAMWKTCRQKQAELATALARLATAQIPADNATPTWRAKISDR